ncbi:carbohydrate ABC transporter permease [Dongia sp.]|uniref:carbohydrate ABC transporter permease n=1 Tax=Dongia sp. TaxID=1977262 RepID=UPI0035B1E50A
MTAPRLSLFEPRRLGSMAPATAIIVYGALIFWSLVVLFPLYWLLVTSVKLPIQVSDGPFYLPFIDFEPSLHAWRYIFVDLGRDTFRPYGNSLITATISTALAMLTGTMAAYALSRMKFRPSILAILVFILAATLAIVSVAWGGVDWRLALAIALALFFLGLRAARPVPSPVLGNGDILFWMISQRIMPPVVSAIPVYVMFQQVGLLDTHAALILTYTTINLPIVVWLMYDFFVSIPRDLEESAELDGASKLRTFFEIVLPLAKPGLVATALLVFILAWNEYLLALFLSTVKAQTIPLLVAAQNATRGPQWWYMSVLIIIMILPVICLTFFLQRFISKGLLLGAVKG